jgi:hypothetical protein
MERVIEQDAREIAGKRPAGAIGAVHAGRETHDEQVGPHRPERRDRQRVVVRMGFANLRQVPRQARAIAAIYGKFVHRSK